MPGKVQVPSRIRAAIESHTELKTVLLPFTGEMM
jgi:hypothetical protein